MKTVFVTLFLLMLCMGGYGKEPMIIAHRGASEDAPENTIAAFELAWRQGADGIEGDFHLTGDGHIVCIHDKDTERVSGEKLLIRESTLQELRPLDVGAWHDETYRGERIPTLAEVFSTVPEDKVIYIEVKSGPEIIPALLEEIDNSGLRLEQIVVISFDKDVIKGLKAKAPQFKAYWLSSLERHKITGMVTPNPAAVLEILKDIRADGVSTNGNADESFVGSILNRGYEHHVWTIDDVDIARKFKEWGSLSITTNIPGVMKKRLP